MTQYGYGGASSAAAAEYQKKVASKWTALQLFSMGFVGVLFSCAIIAAAMPEEAPSLLAIPTVVSGPIKGMVSSSPRKAMQVPTTVSARQPIDLSQELQSTMFVAGPKTSWGGQDVMKRLKLEVGDSRPKAEKMDWEKDQLMPKHVGMNMGLIILSGLATVIAAIGIHKFRRSGPVQSESKPIISASHTVDLGPASLPTSQHPRVAMAAVSGLPFGIKNPFAGERDDTGKYKPTVAQIAALEPAMQALSDEEMAAKTVEFRERLAKGETLDNLLVEAFALAREASVRVLGLRPFDVQLIGGMILNEGKIAEMRTGEGKTLVSVLPAYLNALSGKGVHIVTVNDYLARRDCEVMSQIHRFLGLSCGLVQADMELEKRKEAYRCDITYVTNSEMGFDYLRDNLAAKAEDLVQRPFNFCVIDEVDSILIDEARTPLIISGEEGNPSEKYMKATKLAQALTAGVHYTVDEKMKACLLTEEGYEAAEDVLQIADLYDPKEQWASYVVNALKAKEVQIKDVNYIVKNDEIILIDEFTGRSMPGRRWGEGLHQAVESKEGVTINKETVTIASISYQSLFRIFPKLSGMTGTAATEASEFKDLYNLETAVVPPNLKIAREDFSDVVFKTEGGKWKNVKREIKRIHKEGRPILVGTTSVETSERIAALLDEDDLPYELLNAKPENVEREAQIVSGSGRKGAITIATNMAGRGTDILLGGNPAYMAKLKLTEIIMPRVVENDPEASLKKRAPKTWKVPEKIFPCDLTDECLTMALKAEDLCAKEWGENQLTALEAEDRLAFACDEAPTEDAATLAVRNVFKEMKKEYTVYTSKEKEEVKSLGGLYVIGTERHESRRIDNQLRGRAGRQGDPGSTRYFLSLEDNLFRIFGGDKLKGMMSAFRVDDLPIESGMLTKSLDQAQTKVEAYFYDIRKQLFEYDQVLNTQRDKFYRDRRDVLTFSDKRLNDKFITYAEQTVDDILEANVDPALPPEEWNLDALAGKMCQYCIALEGKLDGEMLRKINDFEEIRKFLRKMAVDAYVAKVEEVDTIEEGLMEEAQRFFILMQMDNLWQKHLGAMKFIQTAVGLRGYAQRDPLVEYKLAGYDLFVDMLQQIRRNAIYSVYMFNPAAARAQQAANAVNQQQAEAGKKAEAAKKSSKKKKQGKK